VKQFIKCALAVGSILFSNGLSAQAAAPVVKTTFEKIPFKAVPNSIDTTDPDAFDRWYIATYPDLLKPPVGAALRQGWIYRQGFGRVFDHHIVIDMPLPLTSGDRLLSLCRVTIERGDQTSEPTVINGDTLTFSIPRGETPCKTSQENWRYDGETEAYDAKNGYDRKPLLFAEANALGKDKAWSARSVIVWKLAVDSSLIPALGAAGVKTKPILTLRELVTAANINRFDPYVTWLFLGRGLAESVLTFGFSVEKASPLATDVGCFIRHKDGKTLFDHDPAVTLWCKRQADRAAKILAKAQQDFPPAVKPF
jgi:hypothetical protein